MEGFKRTRCPLCGSRIVVKSASITTVTHEIPMSDKDNARLGCPVQVTVGLQHARCVNRKCSARWENHHGHKEFKTWVEGDKRVFLDLKYPQPVAATAYSAK